MTLEDFSFLFPFFLKKKEERYSVQMILYTSPAFDYHHQYIDTRQTMNIIPKEDQLRRSSHETNSSFLELLKLHLVRPRTQARNRDKLSSSSTSSHSRSIEQHLIFPPHSRPSTYRALQSTLPLLLIRVFSHEQIVNFESRVVYLPPISSPSSSAVLLTSFPNSSSCLLIFNALDLPSWILAFLSALTLEPSGSGSGQKDRSYLARIESLAP